MRATAAADENALVEQAIARVIEAERAARIAVADAQREAAARIEEARTTARAIGERAERRVIAIRTRFERRIAAEVAAFDEPARAPVSNDTLHADDRASLARAVAALAAELTGGHA